MANYCALCGTQLGFLKAKELVCCGTTQLFCADCQTQLYHTDHMDRTRILLERGKAPTDVERMKKTLSQLEEEQAAKVRAAATYLKCLRCSAPMEKVGRKQFQMGTENFFFDTHMWEGSMELEVVRCPVCRKVEFFLPEDKTAAPPGNEALITCSRCGARHDPSIGCPRCALADSKSGPGSAPKTQKGNKPPWEK